MLNESIKVAQTLKYAIIGTGAIGGYFGGILSKSGQDVHFLFRSDYVFVKDHGLKVDSINGDFILPSVQAYNNTLDMPRCDVVLVCLKSTGNKDLKHILPPLLQDNTVVVLIQNGLGVESDLQKDFPDLYIAGGLAFICATKIAPGHIAHLDFGRLNIGSYSCPDNSILDRISTDFQYAGVQTEVLNLHNARWRKLVWNIPFNGMTVVMNTTTDALIGNADMRQLLHRMMIEVIEAGNMSDLKDNPIPVEYADEIMRMTEDMTPYSPSMKIDFDEKRQMEIEYLYTRPVEYAACFGYSMFCVSVLEKQLKFIQSTINKKLS